MCGRVTLYTVRGHGEKVRETGKGLQSSELSVSTEKVEWPAKQKRITIV